MKKYYINNNSIGNLKVFDEANNCIAKIKHFPMTSKYVLVNNNEQFLLRIDETNPVKHIFSVSFDEDGISPVIEIAKKNNFQIGFGLGHLVLLSFASIPFGAYFGVSKMGDILVQKNGKCHEMAVNGRLIARAEFKKGYLASMLSSKSSLEIVTTDNTLTMYAIAIFLIMDINDYFK